MEREKREPLVIFGALWVSISSPKLSATGRSSTVPRKGDRDLTQKEREGTKKESVCVWEREGDLESEGLGWGGEEGRGNQ